MNPVLVTAPTSVPVSLNDVKAHLKVEHDFEDALISIYLAAATAYFDGHTGILGRALCTQTWEEFYPDFACLDLALAPVSAITTLAYMPSTGSEVVVASSLYALRRNDYGHYIEKSALFPDVALADIDYPVRVRYVAGYGDAASVPAPIKAAILIYVGHLYANSGGPTQLGLSAEVETIIQRLVSPYRRANF